MNESELIKSVLLYIFFIVAFLYTTGKLKYYNTIFKKRNMCAIYFMCFAISLSILCFIFPVTLYDGYKVDLSDIPIALLGLTSGMIPCLIITIILEGYKILLSGQINIHFILLNSLFAVFAGGFLYAIQKLFKKNTFNVNIFSLKNLIILSIFFVLKLFYLFKFTSYGMQNIVIFFTLIVAYIFSIIISGSIIKDLYSSSFKQNTLKEKVFMDELTKLKNYSYIENYIIKMTQEEMQNYKFISILMIDIDDFKYINDIYGHPEGNNILKNISNVLKDCVRDEDVVIRYGGEEFLILLNGANIDIAYNIAERIRNRISIMEFMINNLIKLKKITVSIGISNYPGNSNNIEELIKKADMALYEAKKNGKNTVVKYSEITDFKICDKNIVNNIVTINKKVL